MTYFSSKQVREILGLSSSIVARLIEAGFVMPERGPRRELRYTFQDLVVLRAAKGLADARLPARRISVSLKKLRQQLPQELPATGLRIAAVGNSVAVMEAEDKWRTAEGQYLLAFEVLAPQGHVVVLDRTNGEVAKSAEEWFEEGCRLEETDSADAIAHYRNALAAKICQSGIYTNLALLLHGSGQWSDAEEIYREGIKACPDDALLFFNYGVLLDEQSRAEEAIESYRKALAKDPSFMDAHYNLALLYEAAGKHQEALRHLNACRKLEKI
ncbi:MAG: tetratricopeptide repeat protein [Gammaproteobacteria bacterium]